MLTIAKVKALDSIIERVVSLYPSESGSPVVTAFSDRLLTLSWTTPSSNKGQSIAVTATLHINQDGDFTHAEISLQAKHIYRSDPTPEPTPSTKKDKDKG